MISIISNNEGVVYSNPYPGMSLAEACGALETYSMQVTNDFQMGILLSEHAFLQANGYELSYVDEAGSLSEKAKKLKDAAVNLIKSIGRKIAELWDKLITWIRTQIQKIQVKIRAKYFQNAKVTNKITDLINGYDSVFKDGISVNFAKYMDEAHYASFIKQWQVIFEDKMNTKKAKPIDGGEVTGFFDKFWDNTNNDGVEISKTRFIRAWGVASNANSKNTVIDDVMRDKKKCDDRNKKMIEAVKKAEPEDMEEIIGNIKERMNTQSRITSQGIRVYYQYVNQEITTVQSVLNSAPAKEYLKGADKRAADAEAQRIKDRKKSLKADPKAQAKLKAELQAGDAGKKLAAKRDAESAAARRQAAIDDYNDEREWEEEQRKFYNIESARMFGEAAKFFDDDFDEYEW